MTYTQETIEAVNAIMNGEMYKIFEWKYGKEVFWECVNVTEYALRSIAADAIQGNCEIRIKRPMIDAGEMLKGVKLPKPKFIQKMEYSNNDGFSSGHYGIGFCVECESETDAQAWIDAINKLTGES